MAAVAIEAAGQRVRNCIITIAGAPASQAWRSAAWLPLHHALSASDGSVQVLPYHYDLRSCGLAQHGAQLAEVLSDFRGLQAAAARTLASSDAPTGLPPQDDYPTLSIVTHGLGALVLRAAFAHMHGGSSCAPSSVALHHAVLLAPPNRGSALTRRLFSHAAGRAALRAWCGTHVAEELGTCGSDYFDSLGFLPAHTRVLILAGISPSSLIMRAAARGYPPRSVGDGVLSVAETDMLIAPPDAQQGQGAHGYATAWLERELMRNASAHGGMQHAADRAHAPMPSHAVRVCVAPAGHHSLLLHPRVWALTRAFIRGDTSVYARAQRLMWERPYVRTRRDDVL